MKFLCKEIMGKRGVPIRMLIPWAVPSCITGLEICNGDSYWLLGDSVGQRFLAKVFSCAANLEQGEFIYIPTSFLPNCELQERFPKQTNTFLDLVLLNYCALPLSGKQIEMYLACKTFREHFVDRASRQGRNYFYESWKIDKRLTVKRSKKHMTISANRYLYETMAWAAEEMADTPDEDASNTCAPHIHFEWGEATSKSPGFILEYWYNTPD